MHATRLLRCARISHALSCVSPHVQARAEEEGVRVDEDDQGDIESDDEHNEGEWDEKGGAGCTQAGWPTAAGGGAEESATVPQCMSVGSAAPAPDGPKAIPTTAEGSFSNAHPIAAAPAAAATAALDAVLSCSGAANPDPAAVHPPVAANGASAVLGLVSSADVGKQQPMVRIATIDQGAVQA